jgi:surface polysaccharide O-acyltransferase-like enzyme
LFKNIKQLKIADAAKQESANGRARLSWVDSLRVLLTFVVIFAHESFEVIQHIDYHNLNWWVGNIQLSSMAWCTGAFVMISGMLLLDPYKDEPTIIFYKKRAVKILIPVIFWTIFYTIWQYGMSVLQDEPNSIGYLIKQIVLGKPYYHMWFFYMILGLYLLTPFIRKIVWNSPKKELTYLCAGLFAIAVVANINVYYMQYFNISDVFDFALFLPYFLAGYLIIIMRPVPRTATLLMVIAFSAIVTALGKYYTTKNGIGSVYHPYFLDALSITVVPMSISFMLLVKKASKYIKPSKFISSWSALSFGILLVHPVFIDILKLLGIRAMSIDSLFSIPLMATLVYVLSLLAAMIIRRVPLIKRII